jgi:NAD(P)-dependent dehydrogenase (short-subunit alcohol dehydrogenase family)
MAQELSGKVAVVTGGAGGIGRATAELFVEEGARVVVADVDAEQGEALVASLGDAAVFRRADVSDADDVQGLVELAVSHFGGLDVMFNNAGIGGTRHGSFLEDDLSEFERVMGVNLYGVMVGTQRAARYMVDHGGGSIINTTSIAGIQPGGGVMTYRASKAGVIQFSRSVSIELGRRLVRVNCIAPGLIPTGITNFDHAQVVKVLQPLDRIGEPRDVANAALYLGSDRSAQVTGTVLTVDGGTSVGVTTNPLRKRGGG